MKNLIKIIGVTALTLLVSPLAYSATELWSTEGFKKPESTLYDSGNNIIYVSNIEGPGTEKNGAGHISRLTTDGKVKDMKWVTGLNAPKGLVQHNNLLYVSDIDQLISINIDTGKIDNKWDAKGAKFLNDLAVDDKGRIYVSDMVNSSIYRLENNELSLWLDDDSLQHPNGLLVEGDRLVVAAWGKELQDDFSTKELGHLIAVDLESKSITTIGSGKPVGNLDGIESDGKGGWFVSDWRAGALYKIDSSGKADLILDTNRGSADIGVINSKNMIIVPMMLDNKVIAITPN